jgi:hypothetical protein
MVSELEKYLRNDPELDASEERRQADVCELNLLRARRAMQLIGWGYIVYFGMLASFCATNVLNSLLSVFPYLSAYRGISNFLFDFYFGYIFPLVPRGYYFGHCILVLASCFMVYKAQRFVRMRSGARRALRKVTIKCGGLLGFAFSCFLFSLYTPFLNSPLYRLLYVAVMIAIWWVYILRHLGSDAMLQIFGELPTVEDTDDEAENQ